MLDLPISEHKVVASRTSLSAEAEVVDGLEAASENKDKALTPKWWAIWGNREQRVRRFEISFTNSSSSDKDSMAKTRKN